MATAIGNTCQDKASEFFLSIASRADLEWEDELRRTPYVVRSWVGYADTKIPPKDVPMTAEKVDELRRYRWWVFSRAVRLLPRSYKIWWQYLKDVMEFERDLNIVVSEFEKCLAYLPKMPKLWVLFIEYLIKNRVVTRTRRAINYALRALPVTQHHLVWAVCMRFISEVAPPASTSIALFRRYLMLEPGHAETYIAYLLAQRRWDQAAIELARILSDENFVSINNKTRHDLWLELCTLITDHPLAIKSVNVEAVFRAGIAKFPDEVGALWQGLADFYIHSGEFDKARDIYEEALESVQTIEDFSVIFEFFQKYLEVRIRAAIEQGQEEEGELLLAQLERLVLRRPDLLTCVLLRQNPNNVSAWMKRLALFREDNPERFVKVCTEAVKTEQTYDIVPSPPTPQTHTLQSRQALGALLSVSPSLASGGRVSELWCAFARFYGEVHQDMANARTVYERAVKADFKNVDDLAVVWCDWVELEEKVGTPQSALEVARRAVGSFTGAAEGSVQARLNRCTRLWLLAADLEESVGRSLDAVRATFEAAIRHKVITAQAILNYAAFEADNKFWERSFQVYEKGIGIFKWPHVRDIWVTYLSAFIERYGGSKVERARELFESAVKDVPEQHARLLYLMYCSLEEEHGLIRHALSILRRACRAVQADQQLEMYELLIAKTQDYLGAPACRAVYEEACNGGLKREQDTVLLCIKFSDLEKSLGEIDRARLILQHASQYCNPSLAAEAAHEEGNDLAKASKQLWETWRKFELVHGDEESYREMRRVRRSVEASFSNVHFNAQDVSQQLGEADPMASLELQAGRKDKGEPKTASQENPEAMELALD